jgi:hypothetical protein
MSESPLTISCESINHLCESMNHLWESINHLGRCFNDLRGRVRSVSSLWSGGRFGRGLGRETSAAEAAAAPQVTGVTRVSRTRHVLANIDEMTL